MTRARITLILAGLLVFTAVSATGEEFTFTADDAVWDHAENWYPEEGAPPQAGDKATIPDGKHCRVEEANQAADEVVVEEGGTLGIVGKTLTISGEFGNLHVTVDGTLYLKTPLGPRAPVARLVATAPLIISGSGVVTARRADGYHFGRIEGTRLELDPGITLAGSLHIYTDIIHNDGTLLVDGATDEMRVGRLSSGAPMYHYLGGDGDFKASNGSMLIGGVWLWWSLSGTWTICGGTIQVTEYCVCMSPTVQVTISDGGTLDLDTDFATAGGLDFGNGTMRLGAGQTAFFP